MVTFLISNSAVGLAYKSNMRGHFKHNKKQTRTPTKLRCVTAMRAFPVAMLSGTITVKFSCGGSAYASSAYFGAYGPLYSVYPSKSAGPNCAQSFVAHEMSEMLIPISCEPVSEF